MATRAATRPVRAGSEEWSAARGVLTAVTAATGAMLAAFDLVAGSVPLTLVPAAVLVLGGRSRLPDGLRGLAGTVIWLLVAPHAHGEALLAPLAMAVAWTAIAIGPERFWTWIRAEWSGREAPPASSADAGVAWIEDDLSVR